MRNYLLCLCIMLGYFGACRKDRFNNNNNNNSNDMISSGISGIIQPPRAVTKITAFDSTKGKSYSASPDSSGKFLISHVPAGIYKVSFVIDSSFLSTNMFLTTVVKNNQVTNLGTLQFVPKHTDTSINNGITSVAGNVYPKTAFGSISITSSDGRSHYNTTPDTTGFFLFNNVMPAMYTVHFTITDAALQAPKDTLITVKAGQAFQMGNVYAITKPGYAASKIDTIVGEYLNESDLLSRAPYDSLIVIQGSLSLFNIGNTDVVNSALNKITSVSGLLYISGASSLQSISMSRLTYAGGIYLFGLTSLTSANFSAVKTIGELEFYSTPLSTIGVPSLQTVGSLTLDYTNFANLDMFKNVSFHPFDLEIEHNTALTNISGLHFGSDSVYDLTIESNALTSLNGLQGIKKIKDKLSINDNPSLQTLEGLNNIVNTDQLYIANNPQLTQVCAAKTVTNAVKNRPSYTVRRDNGLGEWVTITIYPFIATNNGSYATNADFINAIAQCP